jgi:hypothetical protein
VRREHQRQQQQHREGAAPPTHRESLRVDENGSTIKTSFGSAGGLVTGGRFAGFFSVGFGGRRDTPRGDPVSSGGLPDRNAGGCEAGSGEVGVGEEAVGELGVGDAAPVAELATGEAIFDESVFGGAAVGEAAVGEAAVGEAAVGEAAVGEAAVGEAVVGEAAADELAVEGSVGDGATVPWGDVDAVERDEEPRSTTDAATASTPPVIARATHLRMPRGAARVRSAWLVVPGARSPRVSTVIAA